MCIGLHIKYSLFMSECNGTWIFWTDFFQKILKCEISWKSVQCEPSSMRTDRQTYRSEKSFFAILRKTPKKSPLLHLPRTKRQGHHALRFILTVSHDGRRHSLRCYSISPWVSAQKVQFIVLQLTFFLFLSLEIFSFGPQTRVTRNEYVHCVRGQVLVVEFTMFWMFSFRLCEVESDYGNACFYFWVMLKD